MDIKQFLKNNIVLLDGAMGTTLQNAGLQLGEHPEALNITNPELVASVHKAYFEAGSNIVLSNTFGASEYKLEECEYSVEEVIEAGISLAKKVASRYNGYVALDIGPIGTLLEPMGNLTFEKAYEIFARQIKAGAKAGADLIFIETMTDLYEVKAAVLAAKENSSLPIFCTMSFEENMRTFTGTSLSAMAITLDGLGVDAIGINCSLGPVEMLPMAKELLKWTDKPIIIKPNAGLPCLVEGKTVFNITKTDFNNAMQEILKIGVSVVGGCCGTTPDMLKEFFVNIKDKNLISRNKIEKLSVICSASNTVIIDKVRVIGERINPTGKALFKQALETNDLDYIARQAVEQANAGADILDVNVGHLGIDEKSMMVAVVKKIQSVCNLPLQIDSSNAQVIEAGLRVVNGKAIVNSVNGEEEKLKEILPIAKKYGASVLGLALDEKGIPETASDRLEVAKKILNTANEYGIEKQDVFIDCLTLASSAQQDIALETIKAISLIKSELGLKTTLGVSNISFGLPNRELLNSTFLSMAMYAGLDMPIINPNIDAVMDSVFAYHQLANIDTSSTKYVERFSNIKKEVVSKDSEKTLDYFISMGLGSEAKNKVKELLKTQKGLDIVENNLIPALDKVGKDYESGKIFLPQLIQSAEAAKLGFEAISENMLKTGDTSYEKKGPIILATVKGDVHDIGKNIVKTVLENYGYDVIDLGKDTDIQLIVDTAKNKNPKLIGLSALMTTTVKSMQETIIALKENNINIPVFVGGAVLTQEFADEIGANFYAKDAQVSVEIAKKIIG